ncbi:hypothetical protein BK140_07755 [Paenibacillus macerans]|nr:hypothetical protein BK140_07755 [Paenibacillus macerans]
MAATISSALKPPHFMKKKFVSGGALKRPAPDANFLHIGDPGVSRVSDAKRYEKGKKDATLPFAGRIDLLVKYYKFTMKVE